MNTYAPCAAWLTRKEAKRLLPLLDFFKDIEGRWYTGFVVARARKEVAERLRGKKIAGKINKKQKG